MSRKSNKNGFVGIIVFIILILIVIGFISSMPWLLIFIIPLAIGAAYEAIASKQKNKPQSTAPSPLTSVVHNDIRIAEDCVNITNNSNSHNEEAPLYAFTSASVHAINAHGDAEKMRQLEHQLPELVNFVQSSFANDGELPPYVPCRDNLPELYMRYGLWEKAENVIRTCISCKAYGHTEYRNNRDHNGHWVSESGDEYLERVRLRHGAADALLAYLAENPGTYQNKIYKIAALSTVDHNSLVWLCRYSHQIRKEKDGKTNRLYIVEISN